MRYLLLLLPLMLLGCADSSTTGSIRNYDIRVDISGNSGPVSLEFPLDVKSASNTDQITENASDIAPDVRFQLTEGGGTGAMSGADAVLKDVTSTLKNQIKERAIEQATEELGIEPEPEEPVVPVKPEPTPEDIPPSEGGLVYETYFLNTQTASPEGGKVLALCPGDTRRFDKCTADGVNLPFHRLYNGGSLYWNMGEAPKGDIVCVLDGKQYLYPATNNDSRGRVTGSCKKPDEPVVKEADIPPQIFAYETKFHHTQTAGPDKGKSLVLCEGQTMQFDSCTSDAVKIPWHGYGDGRETYWNMTEEPKGDIVCKKGDKTYVYPATDVDDRGFTWGKCD